MNEGVSEHLWNVLQSKVAVADAINTRIHREHLSADTPTVAGARGHRIALGDIVITRHNTADIPVWTDTATRTAADPVRNGQLLNFVAFAERTDWAEEGWSIRSSVEELRAEFEGWTPWVLRFMEQVPPNQLFKWGLFDREPLATWTQGRVTLLGDAAHPVLPFLGHGAVLAIEDGAVIARAVAASSSVEEALQRYENARRERAAFVVHESRKAGKQYHAPDADTYRERTQNQAADEGIGLFSYNPVTQAI
jgi:salicylate hydroxylase